MFSTILALVVSQLFFYTVPLADLLDVWGLSGAAVRASVDLGLHHESGLRRNSRTAIETDIRRRVFWM